MLQSCTVSGYPLVRDMSVETNIMCGLKSSWILANCKRP